MKVLQRMLHASMNLLCLLEVCCVFLSGLCVPEPEVTVDAEYVEMSTGEEIRIGEEGGDMPLKDEL